MLNKCGIVDVKTKAFMPLETGGYYATRAERSAEAAAKAGAITDEEKKRWLTTLKDEIFAKRFLGGQVHLFVWGTRDKA